MLCVPFGEFVLRDFDFSATEDEPLCSHCKGLAGETKVSIRQHTHTYAVSIRKQSAYVSIRVSTPAKGSPKKVNPVASPYVSIRIRMQSAYLSIRQHTRCL
jgi:hypothetical protein